VLLYSTNIRLLRSVTWREKEKVSVTATAESWNIWPNSLMNLDTPLPSVKLEMQLTWNPLHWWIIILTSSKRKNTFPAKDASPAVYGCWNLCVLLEKPSQQKSEIPPVLSIHWSIHWSPFLCVAASLPVLPSPCQARTSTTLIRKAVWRLPAAFYLPGNVSANSLPSKSREIQWSMPW